MLLGDKRTSAADASGCAPCRMRVHTQKHAHTPNTVPVEISQPMAVCVQVGAILPCHLSQSSWAAQENTTDLVANNNMTVFLIV